uniref:G_PROTEIN_RECEP_F1_2 domain-containing protein n=1 Tax=Steinernema glaseri TaxID=37863 RepID=A0A1I7YJA9_9BILA
MNTSIQEIIYPHQFAIAAVLITSCIGFVLNAFVIQATVRTKIFGVSFGWICISQCLANLGQLSMFLFFIGPLAAIDMNLLKTYTGGRPGQLLNFFWYSCIMSHLLSSLNRLICLALPLQYNQIFTKRTTTAAMLFIWIFAFVLVIPQFSASCLMTFIESDFSFDFQDTECGRISAQYLDFAFSVSVICAIIVVDVATSLRIVWIRKGIYNTTTRRQVKFFIQTCTEEIILMICVLCFYKVSHYFDGHWMKFVLTTWLWIFAHTADGCVILLFNKELRSKAVLKLLPLMKTIAINVLFLNKSNRVMDGTSSSPNR